MRITSIRHDWPEKAGFLIFRPQGHRRYTFLHFATAVRFRLDGKEVEARPGACIFYAPEVPQWFCSDSDVIHNWFHAENDLGEYLRHYGIPENTLLYPSSTEFISELFRMLEVEYFSTNPRREELMELLTREFLLRLSRALEQEPAAAVPGRGERDKLRRVRQQVLSQPERKWTVEEMASLASLSPSRFHRVYKRLFATSPMQDVIEARIRYARSLLLSDDSLTLPAVAERLGYNDQYHFIRQFKAVTGKTPGAYRRNK